jgi:aminodeoxyfutalosine deaminase
MTSKTDLEAFVRALPKAELHVHLEGSMRPALARRLAARRGVELPSAYRASMSSETPVFADFDEFIALYVALSSCLQQAEDVVATVDDLARRLDEQGVRYAEVTFTPLTHIRRGVPPEVLVEGLVEGRRAARERDVEVRYVFDVVRCFPDQAVPTLDFARAMRARDEASVIGLGIGGPEGARWPTAPLMPVFREARADRFHSVPHAGEQWGPQSIRDALDLAFAERIGHGVRCLEDPALVRELCERGIALEVCPTSNVRLGVCASLAEHPLPRLLEAGLPVSLNSDDPPLFGTDLVTEFLRCAEAFDWSPSTVRALARASLEHAFMPPALRARLTRAQDAIEDP